MLLDLFTWNHMNRIHAVEYRVNQQIIETGKMPNGKKAKPERLNELKERNKQLQATITK